ncbi:MAG TPA: MFS transporter [Bacteroidales bacterium]|nr:MFS transporter [Bacteroidales bacterium]
MRVRNSQDPLDIENILTKCDACYLGMVDDMGMPYVLPFNFGYEGGIIYLHSAKTGRKMEILRNNPNVCINFSTDHQLLLRHKDVACSAGMDFRSVVAFGKVEFIEEYDAKVEALNIIMRKYTGRDFSYNAPAVNNVAVYKVVPTHINAKISGY